jgi:GAF domain-containing protein
MLEEKFEIRIPEEFQKSWQQITDILAQICGVPAALIMRLVETDIEVFIASHGNSNPYRPGSKEHFDNSGLYCETVVKSREKLLVPDALADEDWKDNPDTKLNMVSYLGFPIFLPDGKPFGTICVLDRKRNEYSSLLEQLMQKFKSLIESNLEMIYINQKLGDKNKRLSDYLLEIQALRGLVVICSNCKAIRDQDGRWKPIEQFLTKSPAADFSHGICPVCLAKLYPDFDEKD